MLINVVVCIEALYICRCSYVFLYVYTIYVFSKDLLINQHMDEIVQSPRREVNSMNIVYQGYISCTQ